MIKEPAILGTRTNQSPIIGKNAFDARWNTSPSTYRVHPHVDFDEGLATHEIAPREYIRRREATLNRVKELQVDALPVR